MKRFFKFSTFLLFLIPGIWSCEMDDHQPKPQPQPQHKLEAKAGTDQQVIAGGQVTLDGTASKDGNGKPFEYSWKIKQKPAGSNSALSATSTATTGFTPDIAGNYVVELKIHNALGFATDEVIITATAPGQEQPTEPATIIISENITEDQVLEDVFTDAALADYLVTANIRVSAKLTVKPGVRIEFEQDRGLIVSPEGALSAKGINDETGTSEKRIVFTGKNSTNGSWRGILLMSNSALNELENVTVAHGGGNAFAEMPSLTAANLVLLSTQSSKAAIKIKGSLFYNSGGYGLYVHGISELREFENNYFENNTGAAMYAPARQLHKLDFFSHFSGNNGFNGVETGGNVRHEENVTWPHFNDGSGYFVTHDITIESGVSIQPGATFEFKEGLSMQVRNGAYLNAEGTAASKITFTAHRKEPGYYWGGIIFNSNSAFNKLYFARVSFAGNKQIPDYEGQTANVIISTSGKAIVHSSILSDGLGWGLLAFTDKGAQVNADVNEWNYFMNLSSGPTRLSSGALSQLELAGEWLDEESFTNNLAIDELFYDQEMNRWFRGASSPWTINPRAGFGIKIDEAGNYLWTVAEIGPVAGCGIPHSAEYIKGKVTVRGNQLQFQESYWRSMFYNPCDESQSVDTNITPGTQTLNYSVNRYYDLWTGEPVLELTLSLNGGSTVKYFKR